MKMKLYLAAMLAAAGLVAGCGPNNSSSTPSQTSDQQRMDAARDEYLASIDKRMNELDAKIDSLAAKSSSDLSTEAKARRDQALANLRADRDTVRQQYDKLKISSADAWDKTKADFQTAWDKLAKAYDDAAAKVTGHPPAS